MTIVQIVMRYGVDNERITLEETENAINNDKEQVRTRNYN